MKRKREGRPLTPGSREFFQNFYEENKGLLFYFACKYADIQGEQEDLMQEALVRLLKNAEILCHLSRSQCVKYMELTVKSAWLDMERRRCKEKLILLDEGALEALIGSIQTGASEDAVGETVEKLRSDLTARDWAVLEGKYILGYTDEQLSGLFGISADSMRSLVSRARKRARRILSEKDREGDE